MLQNLLLLWNSFYFSFSIYYFSPSNPVTVIVLGPAEVVAVAAAVAVVDPAAVVFAPVAVVAAVGNHTSSRH